MKISKLVLFLLLLSLLLPAGASQAEPLIPGDDWTFIRPGIDWQKFKLTTPRAIEIFVARLHRGELSATIETGIGQGRVSGGTETTSSMAARYDNAINFWGQAWGNRNDVAVAINGYYFGEPQETPGVPWSGVVHSSWYAHRYSDNIGDAGFTWTHEREAFIGSCVYHTGNKNEVLFERAGTYAPNINAINVARDDESFILYTPQYDANTGTGATALELLVEMSSPSQILPKPAGAVGYIRQIRTSGPTPLYHDYVVLSFWGDVRTAVESRINDGLIAVGDRVTISQEITDCAGLPTLDWTKTYAGLGGDYHFLNNGVIRTDFSNNDANVPNSRTAVAYNANYVYFVVVDGFRTGSIGITIGELGAFLRDNPAIQATDAVSLDSGTSSTMVINGTPVNDIYCTCTRTCDYQLNENEEDLLTGAFPASPDAPNACDPVTSEAYAGTSLMMVSVEPVAQSNTFTPTQGITTKTSTAIRLGPGTNYASLGTVPAGATGEVIDHLNKINGVLAKNGNGVSYWWFVDIGDLAGWVIEESLQGGSLPGPTPTPPGPTPTPTVEPTPIAFTDFSYLPINPQKALGVPAALYGLLQNPPTPALTPVPFPGPAQR